MEENVAAGGYGEAVGAFMKREGLANELYVAAIPDKFIEHGSADQLRQEIGIDVPAIVKGILERVR